ncbi:hypothetical protein [Marinitoga lauensis]|uniref:hypothetical protein n=1 Tax=Marinitoga lauensis TaxID=2201189 RepID=UPI0010110C6F|nr:hypothetical protein [Marinitoga lauensis]
MNNASEKVKSVAKYIAHQTMKRVLPLFLKRYYLIFLVISFSILLFSEKIPVFKEENFIGYINTSLKDSPNKEILNGYWLNLQEINEELDYFILGH